VPRTVSPEPSADVRYGDLRSTPDGRWVLAVRERHAGGSVERTIVALPGLRADGSDDRQSVDLVGGRRFFAAPRPSHCGRWIAWICWDHPSMPWDASELWLGELAQPSLGDGAPEVVGARQVAGGSGESVGQPTWCANGSLAFVSDRAGWWQPWMLVPGNTQRRLCEEEAEFHAPDWALGQSTMAELPSGRLACRFRRGGQDHVGVLDAGSGQLEVVRQPCVTVTSLCVHHGRPMWLGATAQTPPGLWGLGRGSEGRAAEVLGAAGSRLLAPGDVSVGEQRTIRASDGCDVHGRFFRPTLRGVTGPPGAQPPLIVVCHAGPTGAVEAGFDPMVQVFTTRGFAVLGVDYAGSTGYGRAYRDRLRGQWGLRDVSDCVAFAQALAAEGLVDGDRMAVRGSSAGGFTALGALARSDVFVAGVCWYPVTDLAALQAATHDFEAHYNDLLIGPLPQAGDDYRSRSPITMAGDIDAPLLILQGDADPVVPAEQTAAFVRRLESHGATCQFHLYAGESHGFRRAETLIDALGRELAFYDAHLLPTH
jgi:dipeptidyl aminopeptidase/acylaminoacyl peptidase